MSTYLLAFVAAQGLKPASPKGCTSRAEAVCVRVWGAPSQRIGKRVERYMAACLDVLSAALQLPCYLAKLDVAVLEDLHGAAMENWGLITFKADSFPVDDDDAGEPDWHGWTTAAHEVAHAWLGNLATLANWRDLWMHEATATLLAAWVLSKLGTGGVRGRVHAPAAWEEFMSACARAAAKPAGVVLTRQFRSSESTRRVFNSLTYCKGAVMLYQVFRRMGASQFFRALAALVSEHLFGTITPADFVAALHAAAPTLAVETMMQPWLYGK
jgi:aminopeptidase N